MKRAFSIFAILTIITLIAILTIGCRVTEPNTSVSTSLVPETKPAETPPPTAGPEVFVLDSDTVAIGTVGEGSLPIQQGRSIYRDWVFNVEEYVIRPLPEATLRIRILEEDIIPVKGVHLAEGQHLLVFLKKEGDHFIFAGGLMGAKFSVTDGKVQNAVMPSSVWALDDVIASINEVADTWAGETLTTERRIQIQNIALDDSSVKTFLTGKEYEVNIWPYLWDFVSGEIRYAVEIESPNQQSWETDLVVIVNAPREKVDRLTLIVNHYHPGFTETDKDEVQRIALADETVQETIGGRGYEVSQISPDYWVEVKDGITLFHISPMVTLFLHLSHEILYVFVDLDRKEVVKIFTESILSTNPLESSGINREFILTISIKDTQKRCCILGL
jgi:hypothetical protein